MAVVKPASIVRKEARKMYKSSEPIDNEAGSMAGVAGLEPVTSAVTGQRSNQLSYTPAQAGRNLGKRYVHVNA